MILYISTLSKSEHFRKWTFLSQSEHFDVFSDFLFFFQKIYFFNFFWTRKKEYIFSELRIFLGHSFDVKLSVLLIYGVFRAFGARQIWFSAPSRYCEGTKTCSISRIFWRSICLQLFLPNAIILKSHDQNVSHDDSKWSDIQF